MLNLPSEVYFLMIGAGSLKDDTVEEDAIVTLFYSTIIFVGYINNSINFLMYFISGHKFRVAALDTVTCRWCRGRTRPSGKSTAGGRSGGGTRGMTGVTGVEDMSMTTVSVVTKD